MKIQIKQQLSLAFLTVKPFFYKMLALFALSATGQTAFFYRRLCWGLGYARQSLEYYRQSAWTENELWLELSRWPTGSYSFSQVVDESGIRTLFWITLLSLCLLLCLNHRSPGSHYSFARLCSGPRTLLFIQSLCNALCLAALLLGEALLCFIFGLWYEQTALGASAGPQALFLGFWQSPFLHALLPLSEISLWLRNGIFCLSLGTCAACFSKSLREQSRIAFSCLLPVGLVLFFFAGDIGNTAMNAFLCVLLTGITGGAVTTAFLREGSRHEE